MNYVKPLVTILAFVLICFGLYLALPSIKDELSRSIVAQLATGDPFKFNEFSNKIEVQGRKIDSMGTAAAGIKYLADPGFFKRLLSADAREQKRMYDSVLAMIPASVRKEFDRKQEKPTEVGVTTVVIDSVLVEVKVGNSVKFARGSLTYNAEQNSYILELYKDTIEIVDVRGEMHEDGIMLSTVTARSRLTGQQFNVSSDRNILKWEKPKWDWSPYAHAQLGPLWRYEDGKMVPDATLGLSWIKYTMDNGLQWNALNGQINRQGVAVYTGLSYKF